MEIAGLHSTRLLKETPAAPAVVGAFRSVGATDACTVEDDEEGDNSACVKGDGDDDGDDIDDDSDDDDEYGMYECPLSLFISRSSAFISRISCIDGKYVFCDEGNKYDDVRNDTGCCGCGSSVARSADDCTKEDIVEADFTRLAECALVWLLPW